MVAISLFRIIDFLVASRGVSQTHGDLRQTMEILRPLLASNEARGRQETQEAEAVFHFFTYVTTLLLEPLPLVGSRLNQELGVVAAAAA